MKILTPEECIVYGKRVLMNEYNFIDVRKKAGGSQYFRRLSSPFRIRLSDHGKDGRVDSSDVLVNVIFDYPTIKNDIDVRIKNAVYELDSKIRNPKLRS